MTTQNRLLCKSFYHFNAIDHYTEQKIHQILNVFFCDVRSDMTDEISVEACLAVFSLKTTGGRGAREAVRDGVVHHIVRFPVTSFRLSRVSAGRSFQRHPPPPPHSLSLSVSLFIPSDSSLLSVLLSLIHSSPSTSFQILFSYPHGLLLPFDFSNLSFCLFLPPSASFTRNIFAILGLQEASRSGAV